MDGIGRGTNPHQSRTPGIALKVPSAGVGDEEESVQRVEASARSRSSPRRRRRSSSSSSSPLVKCDGLSGRGPHPALDIHLLLDHLSVTFPRHSPAWSPRVLHHGADTHCWRVTGFWRGPRAPGQPRQVFPCTTSDMRRNGAEPLSCLQGPEDGLRGRPGRALNGLCAENEDFVLPLNRN